jgi:hypothetical protein
MFICLIMGYNEENLISMSKITIKSKISDLKSLIDIRVK